MSGCAAKLPLGAAPAELALQLLQRLQLFLHAPQLGQFVRYDDVRFFEIPLSNLTNPILSRCIDDWKPRCGIRLKQIFSAGNQPLRIDELGELNRANLCE